MKLTELQSPSIAILCVVFALYLPNEAALVRRPISEIGLRQKISAYQMLADDNKDDIQACDEKTAGKRSHVYCNGDLIQAVNYHELSPDSKTFVDKPMKEQPEKVIAEFRKNFPKKPENYTEEDVDNLMKFLDDYFLEEGEELETCELKEWRTSSAKIDTIKDPKMREFAIYLNSIWKVLCRKMKDDVKANEQLYSLIYVPNQFVAPGGRFREFYYWDAYWIVKGLLISGLYDATRDMIDNFAYMVSTIGFVPNGGRVYYLQRSQPPFFIPMMYEYYEATKDVEFLKKHLENMTKEVEFWRDKRMLQVEVNNVNHRVFQYHAGSNVPRPESYKEDVRHAKIFEGDKVAQRQLYNEIATIAESGWDFSSRWFSDPYKLITAKITKIAPVDLNAIMCWNYRLLFYLAAEAGNMEMSEKWAIEHSAFMKTFESVFYVNQKKGWYDYHTDTNTHNTENFYPSMAVPLFTECYKELDLSISENLYKRMDELNGLNHPGGIPTSTFENRQQWDYPNGWSPLNHMVIEGLRKSKNPLMQEKAYELAKKWIKRNYEGMGNQKYMWEKYDVSPKIQRGKGGEYVTQAGFGWTNGVVLDLLISYADRLTSEELFEQSNAALKSSGTVVELTAISSFIVLALGILLV